jgi:hypothetical protein
MIMARSLAEIVTEKKYRDPRNRGCGAGARTRTADLRFTKPLLYQLSYAGALKRGGSYTLPDRPAASLPLQNSYE